MKQLIVFLFVSFAATAFCQTSQGTAQAPGSQSQSQSAQSARKCCSKVYFSTLGANGKATTRLVSGNLFKGKERGIDLSLDFLDPKGTPVSGLDAAITNNQAGDIVIDGSKLPKGQKLRLRAKAGKSSETFTLN